MTSNEQLVPVEQIVDEIYNKCVPKGFPQCARDVVDECVAEAVATLTPSIRAQALEEIVPLLEAYSKTFGILTDADRAKFKAALAALKGGQEV